jgi:hypothetical protein
MRHSVSSQGFTHVGSKHQSIKNLIRIATKRDELQIEKPTVPKDIQISRKNISLHRLDNIKVKAENFDDRKLETSFLDL